MNARLGYAYAALMLIGSFSQCVNADTIQTNCLWTETPVGSTPNHIEVRATPSGCIKESEKLDKILSSDAKDRADALDIRTNESMPPACPSGFNFIGKQMESVQSTNVRGLSIYRVVNICRADRHYM
ncbi:hypothetical protein ACI2KR_27340 [Pseudomonas luteola]